MPLAHEAIPRRLLSPRHWPAWIGLLVIRLIACLPYPALMALGRVIGRASGLLMPGRRRTAAINLELCFPQLDQRARARLLRANLANVGVMLVEFALGWMASSRALQRLPVRIEGLEHLQLARMQGRGVLLVGAHFTHLELCARQLAMRIPLAGMYRVMDNPVFEYAVLRARLRYATAMFTKDDLLGCVRHLRHGGVLWYAPDQDMRGKDVVFVPFFGVQAATITATHHLVRLSGAVVLPFAHRRERGGKYVISIRPPVSPFPTSDIRSDITRINQTIEAMVRAAPEQYLWIHKRFKTRPQGVPPPY